MKLFEAISSKAISENRYYLMEHESKQILEYYGLETTGAYFAHTADEAVRIAKEIGYPVVLKVLSSKVLHKSDLGGVKLNLKDEKAVREAFKEIELKFKDLGMIGVSVQKMVEPGMEVIVGVTRDETFGPVIMFGLGGIFVEALGDVSFRAIPITEKDAEEMIKEIKGYSILKGYRGTSADIEAIKNVLLTVSKIVTENPLIKEMDLNPIFVYPKGYKIADARIILSKENNAEIESIKSDFKKLFYPKSVAVIGASNTPGKLGWNVFRNLLTHGFEGRLYPVNPNAEEIQGVKAYKSIKEVPEAVDVAIVLVPAKHTPNAVKECCEAGVKFIIVESAGFSELGEEGKKLEMQMKSEIRKHGCRLVGPNCAGIINTHNGFVGSLGLLEDLGKGNIGLIAQAGVYAAGFLWGLRNIMDFGIIVTIGNKLDVNETDMLEAIGNDENIEVVCMYLEDIKAGRRFIEVAKRITQQKPVIVLKTGRTEEGKKAASTHTASLAGNDRIYSAVFGQVGIIRARDNEHLFALAKAFSKQPLPKNNNVFVITYAGSLGVASADAISLNGLKLADFPKEIKDELKSLMPSFVGSFNPLDLTFDQNPEQVKKVIETALKSQSVGSIVVIMQTEKFKSYVETLRSIDYKGVPVFAVVFGKEFVMEDVIRLEKAGIPVYTTPEQAIEVIATMWKYKEKFRFAEKTEYTGVKAAKGISATP
ncbi:MAG: acetate--CoA ligase family protein [Archaeoglobaceae archaeon]